MQELVSIIIPVYNMERWIERSVQSVLKQSYLNIEIILIDDGSIDNSLNICTKLSREFSNIRVFHQDNQGVSEARNLGLSVARGKYICFLDADDLYCREMVEKLVSAIENNNAEMATCSYYIFNNELSNTETKSDLNESVSENKQNIISTILCDTRYAGYVWNKIFLSNLLRDTKFDSEIKIGEDLHFVLKYMKNVRRAVFLNDKLYGYYDNTEGAMKRTFSDGRLTEFIALDKMLHEWRADRSVCQMLKQRKYQVLIRVGMDALKCKITQNTRLVLRKAYLDNFREFMGSKSPIELKLKYFICLLAFLL